MKLAIIGGGYVGLSLSVLLSRKLNNYVDLFDIDKNLINLINNRLSPIVDKDILYSLKNEKLNLQAKHIDHIKNKYDIYVISTPTNYDEINNYFDTSSVEKSIKTILYINKNAVIVIKSTIPIGFTESMKKKYKTDKIFFSPEFLREGCALYDNYYPSRIIIGTHDEIGINFANLLKGAAKKRHIKILYMSSNEAESVKLFANSYLAMRVAYFNELDTFSRKRDLNPQNIIDGVCSDLRIGEEYNNPSFGYGGYCLPKDVKQLVSETQGIKSPLINSIDKSNESRKQFVASDILRLIDSKQVIGIFNIAMKKNSDNHRFSAILDIIKIFKEKKKNIKIIIYDETIEKKSFRNIKVEKSLKKFKQLSNIIVANRMDKAIKDVEMKVYTRDIFLNN
jgi:UDPglucose 6-dehydrogenase